MSSHLRYNIAVGLPRVIITIGPYNIINKLRDNECQVRTVPDNFDLNHSNLWNLCWDLCKSQFIFLTNANTKSGINRYDVLRPLHNCMPYIGNKVVFLLLHHRK